MVEIFVASNAIDIGEQVTAEKIRLEPWPADRIPEGSVGDLAQLDGKYARQKFYAGEPVMPVKLMDTNTATAPKGYSVVAMKADGENSISNLVQPGDRVDVMAFFTKSELIPRTMTKTVLNGVQVFAIDGNTDRQEPDGKSKTAKTIQLAIRSDDVDAWTYANELGKIRLSLGNPNDYKEPSTASGPSKAAQEFLTWLADHQKAQDTRKTEVVVAPQAPQPVAPEKPKKQSFKMLKMVEGRMVEYEIVEGELPTVVSDTGAKDGTKSEDSGASSPSIDSPPGYPRVPSSQKDFSYLNGENSPLYQSGRGQKTGDSPSSTDGY